MTTLDATHDRELRSWVASANVAGCDFPIHNLPFGRFRQAGTTQSWRIGTAIGDQVLDLRAAGLIDTDDMNVLMAAAPSERRALRARISEAAVGLPNGEKRTFLDDGDTLILRGFCEAEGFTRIGLGEASGTILAP